MKIFRGISADNLAAASIVVNGIYERSQILADHPEIGYRYHSSSRQIRILLYGHYRIAYLVKDSGDVDILGVFHGVLDITRYCL